MDNQQSNDFVNQEQDFHQEHIDRVNMIDLLAVNAQIYKDNYNDCLAALDWLARTGQLHNSDYKDYG